MKKQLQVLLMTLTFMLVFIPLTVFADSTPKPVSLTYEGADVFYYPNSDGGTNEFRTEGNKIIEKYSDGSTKTYICKEVEEGESVRGEYFLNGEPVKNEYGEYDGAAFNIDHGDGYIPPGTEEVDIYREYYDDDANDWVRVTGKLKVKEYPRPVSLTYEGAALFYTAGDYSVDGFRTANNKITETYDDGSKKVFIAKTYTDVFHDTMTDWFLDGDTSSVTDEDGNVSYPNREWFTLDISDDGIPAGKKSLKFYTDEYYGDDELRVEGTLNINEYPKPVSATFKGKISNVYIGQKEISLGTLHGKGNEINVKYSDGTTTKYKYITYKSGKYTYSGFYKDGKKNGDEIWGYYEKKIKKGKKDITFKLSVDDERGYYSNIKMKVSVNAKKLYAYTDYKEYVYTGKVIKPKVVVKDGNGKTIPSKAYTIKYYNAKKDKYVKKPLGKKYGYYDYKITFKKAYKKKYISEIWGAYSITTKPTKIKSLTAGKEKFTAKWNKVKGVDGYVVEYSTSKNFKYYDSYEAAKSKTSATVSNLEKGKTYYVRVSTRKKTKYINDETIYVHSKPSAVRSVKVK